MGNAIIHYAGHRGELYPALVMARLTQTSLSFLYECEQEGLVDGYDLPQGGRGYLIDDVYTLARIRRLYVDLELDLHAIAVVLHLRRQVEFLHYEMNILRQQVEQHEQVFHTNVWRDDNANI